MCGIDLLIGLDDLGRISAVPTDDVGKSETVVDGGSWLLNYRPHGDEIGLRLKYSSCDSGQLGLPD